jgi:hypothetical protein
MVVLCFNSCVSNLLDQESTTDLNSNSYWKTEADATTALQGAYATTRIVFDRDYYFDGHGEYARTRGTSRNGSGSFHNPSSYGSGFDDYYKKCYGAINHLNYVIENVTKMLDTAPESSIASLEEIIGEARLLRGMVHFRLISMWGDIVYLDKIVENNNDVETISRTSIRDVKKSIEDDFTYAYEKLPAKPAKYGRASKWVALGFRGKLHLYWACWNRTSWPWEPIGGWPELENFTPNQEESNESYLLASKDFENVIDNSGISLFRNGEPGNLGELGGSEVLPNYFYLFLPTANADRELMMTFTHGGTGTGQSEELMRDFGTRINEGSQCWCQPRFQIINRFQSTITGDFCEPLVAINPKETDARTRENSTLNPKSYENRDYRMKSIMLWEDETIMSSNARKETGFKRYRYKQLTGVIDGLGAINSDGDQTGYISRKFVRNYAGLGRSEGDYSFPVLRLADIYLMYAESSNEAYGPTSKAIDVVNKIRYRGNLPALKSEKTADKLSFFEAIEQERIVELFYEGHRGFDLRRWRMMNKIWGEPFGSGIRMYDTHGGQRGHYFNNASDLTFNRLYIFRIPPKERNRNPNLTQNTPWL